MALGACSDSDADTSAGVTTTTEGHRATTSSTAAASTSTTLSDEELIMARYRGFWEARLAANGAPANPDDPELAEYAVGAQLDNVITETRERRDMGLAIRQPDPSVSERRVVVVSVVGDEATVQDCATSDGIVYRTDTDEVLDDAVVTRSVEATMQRVGGVWKLAATRVLQEWEGVAGCALSSDFVSP